MTGCLEGKKKQQTKPVKTFFCIFAPQVGKNIRSSTKHNVLSSEREDRLQMYLLNHVK